MHLHSDINVNHKYNLLTNTNTKLMCTLYDGEKKKGRGGEVVKKYMFVHFRKR